ncbi:IPT/TIG domain-containing protein [Hymenobacter sp. ASUV-10]|uniref:IPT/TIG domain-containing protein n=1 Tax=Hymenobacter aranciens TaxID=3063996 RepID=A0ABT9B972_9BACT|nr:IPT/TIG domain-containing protein [Hymenobacter sp. ASUV-10]MDO7874712.1 IPT/TIG domain-containing protein [Hymenobacter sp. ASUV-10]
MQDFFTGLNALRRGLGAVLLAGLGLSAQAQVQQRASNLFLEDAAAVNAARSSAHADAFRHARPLTLNASAMQATLAAAPLEGRGAGVLVALPLPDGSVGRFAVVEAPVMEPGLAAQFPEIKTYAGIGLDDAGATVRLDLTPGGFHAQILSPTAGTIYIDPVTRTDTQHYLSFFRHDMNRAAAGEVPVCGFRSTAAQAAATARRQAAAPAILAQRATGATLRTYRLAVAATGEYTAFHGGTVARAQAAIVTSVNRVVGVYEKELAVRMVLVANNSSLVYTNANTDPYTNEDPDALLTQNQSNVTSIIGNANYDIGHVFSTGGGGYAGLGVVCNSTEKAQGETGSDSPVGDAFDIDYVAHEMGHQFGADHTFNGNGGSCQGNRNTTTAFEPGGGTTIMAYAGICGTANDLQNNSDAYFHVGSYVEIQAYLATTSCGTTAATGNTAPVVSGPASGKTLPMSTPFKLTATGSDADNDALTYCWEQYDTGAAGSPTAAQVAGRTVPLFRSFTPVASPTRYFPRLSNLIANTTNIGERLPTVARTMKFRVTARDQHVGTVGTIGGVNYSADVDLTVVSTAGPFAVSAPNTALTWITGTSQTVTWAVANTNVAPVSCANVNILLSTDGGLTYPTVLLANTPNDGTQAITVPTIANTTTARVMVEAADNYFFDISNANFSIIAPVVPVITSLNPVSGVVGSTVTITGTGFLGTSAVSFNGTAATTFTVVSNTSITVTVPVGATTGSVTVTNPAGTSNGVNFTVTLPVPTISGLSPASAPVGTTVTITGTNLGSASSVTLNGTSLTFTQVSGTSISFIVPAGATSGPVVVTTPLGNSNSTTFTVTIPAPVITSLAPTSGLVGITVTITGTGFTGATGVTFNGTAATAFTVVSATSITVTVPAGATTGLVRVLSPNGISNGATFTVIPPAPVITALVPASATVGTVVTISGTNLTGATGVSFNGIAGTSVTVVNATTITVVVPAGATTGNLTVTTPGGTSNGLPFTVTLPVPAITRLNPTSGLVGTTVTITGTGFSGATAVSFNGTAATFTVVSATSITVTVPAGASTGAVTVTTPGGTSNGVTFTVTLPAPTITSLAPATGPVGTTVTITGTGFSGATSVSFNGTAATVFTIVSATSVTATVPTGASTGNVTVTTPNGTSNGVTFTVTIGTATQAANSTSFAVYPNPASLAQALQVQLDAPTRSATCLLRNVLGQTVAQQHFSGSRTEVSTTGLAAGTYLLSVQAEGEAPTSRRIVLK